MKPDCSCGREHVQTRISTRREFLARMGGGFGTLGLAGLLQQSGFLSASASAATPTNPLAPKSTHFAGKAKSVIWLFMYGGPSGFDLFDPKPMLKKHDGSKPPMKIETFFGDPGNLMDSPYAFKQYGRSG